MTRTYLGMRVVEYTDDIIDIIMFNDISIKIIDPNQIPRSPNNVLVNLLERRLEYYEKFSKIVDGLRGMVQPIQDVNEVYIPLKMILYDMIYIRFFLRKKTTTAYLLIYVHMFIFISLFIFFNCIDCGDCNAPLEFCT